MIDGDPLDPATPALLQRGAHLAVLRILAQQCQEDLDRLVEEADVHARRGYVLDLTDGAARVEHGREGARLRRGLASAAADLQEAQAALREAVLDDAWTPSDDLDWAAFSR